jgi:hypothetical protein
MGMLLLLDLCGVLTLQFDISTIRGIAKALSTTVFKANLGSLAVSTDLTGFLTLRVAVTVILVEHNFGFFVNLNKNRVTRHNVN